MRSYDVARKYFSIIEFFGWVTIAIGVLTVVMLGIVGQGVARGFGGPTAGSGLLGLFPGLMVAMIGVIIIGMAQYWRAGVDTAEYTQQMLKIARDQLAVSQQGLRMGSTQPRSFSEAADSEASKPRGQSAWSETLGGTAAWAGGASVIAPFFADDDGYGHFKTLRARLDANLSATHRVNPIFPAEYKGEDVVETYLAGTLLRELFALRTPFAIPEERRYEHMHIVAGSGHGKTQTLQYFIGKDLADVSRGDKSVVVIDSQGDLLNTILKAKALPPERIVLIDPEDIEYPVSLNLFSVGQERLERYDPLERERLTNSIIELYDFVLGSLLSAGMTAKQSVVFRFVTRLMFHIPDATIHTLRELMEPGGTERYRAYIDKLDGTPRRFFETEFDSKEFAMTKTQVLRRLYGVLENQTFERMFSHPESKFDMFSEMNAGKLVLINTSKSLLKEQGTETSGASSSPSPMR